MNPSRPPDLHARLHDARWFPVDLDVPGQLLHFLRVEESQIREATFADSRLDVDWAAAERIPVERIASVAFEVPAPAWLWHTSFCGSTLLARMLHLTPHTVALREPLVLRRLSDAADAGAGAAVEACLDPCIALLARPWHAAGRVVVKPTHAALNIASQAMRRAPASRAIVLTSALEDFIVSHLKKTAETLARVPLLATRALRAGGFAARLGGDALAPPDILCAAALQWAAQRELVADLLDAGGGRVRVFDFRALVEAPEATASACAGWLQLPAPDAALREQARDLATRHAKAPSRDYDARALQAEGGWLRGQYRNEIARTLAWAERHVLPAMRPVALAPDPGGQDQA